MFVFGFGFKNSSKYSDDPCSRNLKMIPSSERQWVSLINVAVSLLKLKNHQIGRKSFHVLNRVDVDSYRRGVWTRRKPQTH
jgi:hypothetical protein